MKSLLIIVLLVAFALWYARRSPRWVYEVIVKPVLSPVVNYTIYYFRRFVFFESSEKARREFYEGYAKDQRRLAKQKTLTNIAVVNKNRNKYTETFINRKIDGLKETYYVHQFYGGYFPTSEVHYNHLLSENELVLKFVELWELFWNKGRSHYLKKAFRKYLLRNDVKIVLAEFGTVGLEIMNSCKEAKLPLIVTLRGYDIHHRETFETNQSRYAELFTYASLIICVSEDIRDKVKKLFDVEDKLLYLPSPIDLELFSYSDHSANPPVFIAVGRFAETKSPHLTILAFNETLKQIPDAKLVMIGRDGGGELFEACHILVRALNIQDKVEFCGVLSPENVAKEMKKARVFVQHSLTTPINGDKEGTPVSIREAMACGLPVVATRHAGIIETIQSGKNGVLVEEYDYLAMANEMLRVCQSDNLVQELGVNAAASMRSNELIIHNKDLLRKMIEKYRLR